MTMRCTTQPPTTSDLPSPNLAGVVVMILGCHLVPRIHKYSIDRDFTVALGAGKMITSITTTVFQVLVFRISCTYDRMGEHKSLLLAVYAIAAGAFPPLGMLMLPKTVCYLVLIFTFLKAVTVFGSIKTIDMGKKIMSKP